MANYLFFISSLVLNKHWRSLQKMRSAPLLRYTYVHHCETQSYGIQFDPFKHAANAPASMWIVSWMHFNGFKTHVYHSLWSRENIRSLFLKNTHHHNIYLASILVGMVGTYSTYLLLCTVPYHLLFVPTSTYLLEEGFNADGRKRPEAIL